MGMTAHLNKLSFPHPMEPPYEIWLQSAQCFLTKRCLKSVDDGRTDDRLKTTEAYLSYKLTNEPSAQVSQKILNIAAPEIIELS